jgi:hypothetical protein
MTKTSLAAAAVLLFAAAGAATAAPVNTLYTFCVVNNCEDGQSPLGRPVLDTAGNLYGTTNNGGDYASNAGIVWQLAPQGDGTWTFKTIYKFCAHVNCTDGEFAHSGLIADARGDLYGITSFGGKYDQGVVYELMPNAGKRFWKLKVMHNFCAEQNCQDGRGPNSDLTYSGAASGTPYDGVSPLFGVTEEGGNNSYGTVFRLSLHNGHWKHRVLYSFCAQANCSDGGFPFNTPVVDDAGNVYGTTSHGNGLVYKVSSVDRTETVVYSFCQQANCADGLGSGPLTIDSSGALIGATGGGGSGASCPDNYIGGCGTIFRIALDGKQPKEHVLHSFCQLPDCADGDSPQALQLDPAGNIFGATYYGGGNDRDMNGFGGGTLFQLKGKNYKRLHAFCSKPNCSDGEYPIAGFAIGSGGAVYGTTPEGGRDAYYGEGTVFQFTP